MNKKPGYVLSDEFSSRNENNLKSVIGTNERPIENHSQSNFSNMNKSSPDETNRASQLKKQLVNNQSAGTQILDVAIKQVELRDKSPRLDTVRRSSLARRRKKEGFLKDFSYRKQESIQLDEILVKMEDSVNYDDFRVALQNAPKGGISPLSTSQKETE